MNAGQRMARVAAGAAAENVVYAARSWGWPAEIGQQGACGLSVMVAGGPLVAEAPAEERCELPAALVCRTTNRRKYAGRAVEPRVVEELAGAAGGCDGVQVAWVVERRRVEELGWRIGRADGLLFGIEAARRAFLENIRFDRPAREAVREGLSLASLEMGPTERLGLGTLRWMPQRLFQVLGLSRLFARRAEELVRSASGLFVILTRGWEAAGDFAVGQQMERAWLALTSRGLAVQPMMSLPVLENMVQEGVIEAGGPLAAQVRQLATELCLMAAGSARERVAAVLRFGYAAEPSGRVGRRPVEEVLQAGQAGGAQSTGPAVETEPPVATQPAVATQPPVATGPKAETRPKAAAGPAGPTGLVRAGAAGG